MPSGQQSAAVIRTGDRTPTIDGKDPTLQEKEETIRDLGTFEATATRTPVRRRLRLRRRSNPRCPGASRRSIVRGGHGEANLGFTLDESDGVSGCYRKHGASLEASESQPWSPRARWY